MQLSKWKELSREQVFSKYGKIIEKVCYRLPSGKDDDYYIRKSVQHPVCILAFTEDQQVILAQQYRPGPDEILLELPGGSVNGEESAEQGIARELREETGYEGKVQLVTRCHDDAYANTNRYVFVATGCKKVAEQQLDENEFIEVVFVSLPEFRNVLRSGKMTDVGAGYMGLDFLGLL